jgi:protein-disulfide isomerase
LKKYATQVGLDRKRFNVADKARAVIRRDMEDGEVYGVEATLSLFINGATLTDYSADGLRAAIEKAFVGAEKRTP